MTTPHTSRRRASTHRFAMTALAASLVFAAGCSSGEDASSSADLDAVAVAAELPVVTVAPTTSTTEAPVVTEPPLPESTDELAAFGEANSELMADWGVQLAAFGEEATSFLADVSQAPAAASALELSDQVIEAVGTDTSDEALVMIRDFASEMSTALSLSFDGDQEGALTTFIELQSQAERFAAVIDQMNA